MYGVDQSDIRKLRDEIELLKIRVRRMETATVDVRVSPAFFDCMGHQFTPISVNPWVDPT